MEPLYLSKSRLACFCTCPQKYKLTYIDKIVPEKTPTNMVEGSAIHHIVEQAIVYKAVPNMADVAAQEFWNKIELSSVAYESQEDFTAAQEKVLSESKRFLELIGDLNTYQLETYMEHPLVNPENGEVDESIVIRGFADLIDKPAPKTTRIIDLKTSAKSPSQDQANKSIDLDVYSYLMACQFGFECEIPVSLLYLVRAKEPKIVWLNSLRKSDDFLNVYDMIVSIASAIRQNLFWKNAGMNCGWCDHKDLCFANRMAA